MKDVVIAGYARSPFGVAHKGTLTKVRPDDLCAAVVRSLVKRTGVDPEDVEDLIVGCAMPEGEQGFNLARYVVFLADRRCRRSTWPPAMCRWALATCSSAPASNR
jgi:acetyl-CoA acyltransferase